MSRRFIEVHSGDSGRGNGAGFGLGLLLVLAIAIAIVANKRPVTSQETSTIGHATSVKSIDKAKKLVTDLNAKVSLGRVARATTQVNVYSQPSTRSHVYYRVPNREYLVVKNYKRGNPWKCVLMKNGIYAYAESAKLQLLDYEYVAPKARIATTQERAVSFAEARIGDAVKSSKLVQDAFASVGKKLPRPASEQVNFGSPIRRLEDLRRGDRLYFWDNKAGRVGETGIYVDRGNFIHGTSKGVRLDYLGDKKFMKQLVAARR
jgi:hypothetical protein